MVGRKCEKRSENVWWGGWTGGDGSRRAKLSQIMSPYKLAINTSQTLPPPQTLPRYSEIPADLQLVRAKSTSAYRKYQGVHPKVDGVTGEVTHYTAEIYYAPGKNRKVNLGKFKRETDAARAVKIAKIMMNDLGVDGRMALPVDTFLDHVDAHLVGVDYVRVRKVNMVKQSESV